MAVSKAPTTLRRGSAGHSAAGTHELRTRRDKRSVTSGPTPSASSAAPATRVFQQRRLALAEIRRGVAEHRAQGRSGIECCHWLSDRMDDFIREIVAADVTQADGKLKEAYAVLAVGGSGRRRPAPYSDVDLLFLVDQRHFEDARQLMATVTRNCWDTGIQLGSSIRSSADVVRFATDDTQFATALITTRVLAGNPKLAESTLQQVRAKCFSAGQERLILKFVAARRQEWHERGDSVNQLEPDLKRSPGGLRDIHLLEWIAFARFGQPDLAELVRAGTITDEELTALNAADDYLTTMRTDLHCRTGLKTDVLTRELQLAVSEERGVRSTDLSRPVEVFMQEYFGHTARVARITRRVSDVTPRPSLLKRIRNTVFPRRTARGFVIVEEVLHVPDELLPALQEPETLLDVFVAMAEHRVRLSPDLLQRITRRAKRLTDEPSLAVCDRFRDLMRFTTGLPQALRSMYETGVLEWLIPPFARIRNLTQFNQYHHFTVDEHTMKAMDEIVAFENDPSPVGSAYQEIRHRATLHLAMLMHDVGKGFEGDHSIVGEQLCEEIGVRLQMAANKKTMMMFLVRWHLIMPDIAYLRDITDPALLIDFARLVGAPELLRMLFVLTNADIRAVGPKVWTDWKGELLSDFYNRVLQLLSGRPYNHLERERLQRVRETVRRQLVPLAPTPSSSADAAPDPSASDAVSTWVDQQLDTLPPFYLMMEDPSRIARDLDMIQQLTDTDARIEGTYEPDTETVSYRIFAPGRLAEGSFHTIAGILSGLRMNILAAQICTTAQGVVIASFRVTDNDFSGPVPESRIEDVTVAIGDVLTAKQPFEKVFRRSGLYRFNRKNPAIVRAEPKVSIDNDTSERFTVVSVFATDTQGLLYTLAQTLFNHGLTVHLARIATNIDQVVDVFYVQNSERKKLEDSERLQALTASLMEEIRKLGAA